MFNNSLTTILTYQIAKAAHKNITAGANPKEIKRGIELAVNKLSDKINSMAVPLKDEDIIHIATVSAQDDEIGALVNGAYQKLGRDAIITVEEAGSEMSVDYKEGMAFDKGFSNSNFINKPDTNECEIKEPYILVTARVSN